MSESSLSGVSVYYGDMSPGTGRKGFNDPVPFPNAPKKVIAPLGIGFKDLGLQLSGPNAITTSTAEYVASFGSPPYIFSVTQTPPASTTVTKTIDFESEASLDIFTDSYGNTLPSGNWDWSTNAHDGAQSLYTFEDGFASAQFTDTFAAGTFSFWFTINGDRYNTGLRIFIDDVDLSPPDTLYPANGTGWSDYWDWTQFTTEVTAGLHTVRFEVDWYGEVWIDTIQYQAGDSGSIPVVLTVNNDIAAISNITRGIDSITVRVEDQDSDHVSITATCAIPEMINIYRGTDFYFDRPSFVDGSDPAYQDIITPQLTLARGSSRGWYNAKVETMWEEVGWAGPADTMWAFEGYHGNPTGDAFNIDQVHNLFWYQWQYAMDRSASSMNGVKGIVHILSTDTYFEIVNDAWGGESDAQFAYYRSDTSNPPEQVAKKLRDIPVGWTLFEKKTGDDSYLLDDNGFAINQDHICDELWIVRENKGPLFNGVTEPLGPDSASSPADTLWAYLNNNGNTDVEADFTIQNVLDLSFGAWQDSYDENPPAIQGVLGITKIVSTNKFFYSKIITWDSGESVPGYTGWSWMRSQLFDGPPPPPPPAGFLELFNRTDEYTLAMLDRNMNEIILCLKDSDGDGGITPFVRIVYINKATGETLQEVIDDPYNDFQIGQVALGYGGTALCFKNSQSQLSVYDLSTKVMTNSTNAMVNGNFPGNMAAFGYHVYVADYGWSPWGDYCIHKCDLTGARLAVSPSLGGTVYHMYINQLGELYASATNGINGNAFASTHKIVRSNMSVAWSFIHNDQMGGHAIHAHNNLTVDAGVLYTAHDYPGAFHIVNSNTGAELFSSTYTDMGFPGASIRSMTADASGCFMAIAQNNEITLFKVTPTGTVTTINTPKDGFSNRTNIINTDTFLYLGTDGWSYPVISADLYRISKP
jgi:hypothetical protein